MLSSISIEWNFNLINLGSPAPTHVQHITSAASKSSFSANFFNILYLFSSTELSSPVSSFNCCNFCCSVFPSIFLIWLCNARKLTGESIASRDFAQSLTTCKDFFYRNRSKLIYFIINPIIVTYL